MNNTLAIVKLNRIRNNAEALKRRAGKPLYAVIKDNAYGHGAEAVAHALTEIAGGFAVATAAEGISLRIAGVNKEILLLSPPVNEYEVLQCSAYGLTVIVSSFAVLRIVQSAMCNFGCSVQAHIAVNTGMNRYGFAPERINRALEACGGMEITGVFSHLYAPQDNAARMAQKRLFEKAASEVKKAYPEAIRHLAATGGVLKGDVMFDAVRCGIGLYGYVPEGLKNDLELKPAMRVYAPVAHSAKFIGGGAGYQKAKKAYDMLTTLRYGYGDGFFRTGEKMGALCMDAALKEGYLPVGKRKLILKNAEAYARAHNTSVYEVLTRIGNEAVKIYS